jgi:hypothetical protein
VSMTTPFEVRERELAAADAELAAMRSAMQTALVAHEAWEAAKERYRERVRLAHERYYKALEVAVAAEERRAGGDPGRPGDEIEDCRVPNSDTARGMVGPGKARAGYEIGGLASELARALLVARAGPANMEAMMDMAARARLDLPENAAAKREYERLLAEVAGAMHDSPAAIALAKFQQDWQDAPRLALERQAAAWAKIAEEAAAAKKAAASAKAAKPKEKKS